MQYCRCHARWSAGPCSLDGVDALGKRAFQGLICSSLSAHLCIVLYNLPIHINREHTDGDRTC